MQTFVLFVSARRGRVSQGLLQRFINKNTQASLKLMKCIANALFLRGVV